MALCEGKEEDEKVSRRSFFLRSRDSVSDDAPVVGVDVGDGLVAERLLALHHDLELALLEREAELDELRATTGSSQRLRRARGARRR